MTDEPTDEQLEDQLRQALDAAPKVVLVLKAEYAGSIAGLLNLALCHPQVRSDAPDVYVAGDRCMRQILGQLPEAARRILESELSITPPTPDPPAHDRQLRDVVSTINPEAN